MNRVIVSALLALAISLGLGLWWLQPEPDTQASMVQLTPSSHSRATPVSQPVTGSQTPDPPHGSPSQRDPARRSGSGIPEIRRVVFGGQRQ